MRLFVAAELPADLRAGLAALQQQLRDLPLPVRWARSEGIHLTLRFLGECPGDRLADLIRMLGGDGPRGIAPFELQAEGVGTFPERGLPRVIWVGVRGDLGAARRLKGAIDRALQEFGRSTEDESFSPHLTLGRVKGPGGGDWRSFLGKFSDVSLGSFGIRRFHLFESLLGPGGATYKSLAEFSLPAQESR